MTGPPELTSKTLLSKGYLHDRLIPPLDSSSLGDVLSDLADLTDGDEPSPSRSRCSQHSVPKRGHLRRTLSIPNPYHQIRLCNLVEAHSALFLGRANESSISLSKPVLDSDTALKSEHRLSQQPILRASLSTGKRVLLRADISRFYPSIYTHSIAWAIHGKEEARARGTYNLPGNQLDRAVYVTQDKQTGGVPIGPSTSFLIGEMVAAHIDRELERSVGKLHGTRFIDDYYLYFDSTSAAEAALAALHKIAGSFGLEVNDAKTSISALPDLLEPEWKSELRAIYLHESPRDAGRQESDFLGLFNRAISFSQLFPQDSVLTYAARQVLQSTIHQDNWKVCQSFLLRATLAEPGIIEHIVRWSKNEEYQFDERGLSNTINSLCSYHAPLQQGYEVAWALWLAKHYSVKIPKEVADPIASCDDDVVALISLDLRNLGLFPSDTDISLWESHVNSELLYSEHWLLAYEAAIKGWIETDDAYFDEDDFFRELKEREVSFYDGEKADPQESAAKYDDGNEWAGALDDIEIDDEIDELTEIDAPAGSDGKPQ